MIVFKLCLIENSLKSWDILIREDLTPNIDTLLKQISFQNTLKISAFHEAITLFEIISANLVKNNWKILEHKILATSIIKTFVFEKEKFFEVNYD